MTKLIYLFTLVSLLLYSKPPALTPAIVNKKANQILHSHIQHKSLDIEIGRRMLLNFLEELDPAKIYLTENEVAAWIDPSKEMVQAMINEFQKGVFTTFETLYAVMLNAIERMRNLTDDTATTQDYPKDVKNEEFKDISWAKDEKALLVRNVRLKGLQLSFAKQLNETQALFLKRIQKLRNGKEEELIQSSNPKLQKQQCLTLVIKSLAKSLDAHTFYFTPDEASQFIIQIQQRLFGIGAQLHDSLNGFTVMNIIEGGPADRSKLLQVNDRIIAVNGEPVIGMDIVEGTSLIRGAKGTEVVLTLIRKSLLGEEKLDVTIIRDEIVLKDTRIDASYELFGKGAIARIRLGSFYQDDNYSSATDIQQALQDLQKEHRLDGVILDLRNNAGGLLPQAVAVTGLFIQRGIVVSIKDCQNNIQHLRNLEKSRAFDGPLIVLTNKASASAAEIVAQTLQDYGRALVVGESHTFGKGSYQTFTLDTNNTGAVNQEGEFKVTRGLYYTVSGKSPQLNGVKPDIEVAGYLSHLEIGERFAPFPLDNNAISPQFQDKMTDIHPLYRSRIAAQYKRGQQKKEELYSSLLPTLRNNSTHRVKTNAPYCKFLEYLQSETATAESPFPPPDYQLEETMNIMKDLIMLQSREMEKSA